MKSYKYLIIGNGMTANAAVRGIRELDAEGSIGVIGVESDQPYKRPPLSKGLWKGLPFEKIWLNTQNYNVEFHLGRKAAELDPAAKKVRDDQGEVYTYNKLLLATGGSPIHLPFGGEEIIYYRTLQDYQRLHELAITGKRFLIIGAGFIGSEVAAALTMNGKEVTMVFLENSIGENIFPHELSQFMNAVYREKGVELVPADGVASIERVGDQISVETQKGHVFDVDGVVAGLGLRPNVELAKSAGLKIENGIVVDEYTRTSAPDIFAAGDVAIFPHALLKRMIRVEHADNAFSMGKQAGRNMAGANEAYTHAPYFYSDLFEYGYEAIGMLSSKLPLVADWQEPYKKGTVYYLDAGRVCGVLLWNVWDKVPEAARLIAEPGTFTAHDLVGRIKPD